MSDGVYAAGLFVLAITAAMVLLILAGQVGDYLARREIARRDAMRRHPSARTSLDFTSDAARRYHGDDSVGRN